MNIRSEEWREVEAFALTHLAKARDSLESTQISDVRAHLLRGEIVFIKKLLKLPAGKQQTENTNEQR